MTQNVVTQAGTDYASGWPAVWGNFLNSFLTQHSGTTRPSYVQTGTCWLKSSTNEVYFYDGANDVLLYKIDATNHLLIPQVGGGSSTVASAGTTDLGSVSHAALTISGTTPITSFGSNVGDGQIKFLTFSGALTLTHNATSLILPGAANIVTAAGDVAIMRSLGSGNWKCLSYVSADGKPVTSKNPSAFLAKNSNSFSATNKITSWTEIYDSGGDFDASTGRFVARFAGKHNFSWGLANQSGASGLLTVPIYKNGSSLAMASIAPAVSFAGSSLSMVLDLAISDYVELFVTVGTSHNDSNYNVFSGAFIG